MRIYVERHSLPHLLQEPQFLGIEELLQGFSVLRSSLDIDGYAGSKLNQLDLRAWQKHQERFSWIFIDLIDGTPYFHGKALYIFQKEIK